MVALVSTTTVNNVLVNSKILIVLRALYKPIKVEA